jgi:hypothetical protein
LLLLDPFGFSVGQDLKANIGFQKFKEKLTDIGLFKVLHKHWIEFFGFNQDFG